LPDTFAGGFTNFNRYYFAQVGKEAVAEEESVAKTAGSSDYQRTAAGNGRSN